MSPGAEGKLRGQSYSQTRTAKACDATLAPKDCKGNAFTILLDRNPARPGPASSSSQSPKGV